MARAVQPRSALVTPTPPLMVQRSRRNLSVNALGRRAKFLAISVVLGAAITAAQCWLAAWDLSIPAARPAGLIGRGPSFTEPVALRWYRRLIPRWACAQSAYDLDRLLALDSTQEDASNQLGSKHDGRVAREEAAGHFIADNTLVSFEVGEGLYDRIVRTRAREIRPENTPLDADGTARAGDWLGLELDRHVSDPSAFDLKPPQPARLGSRAFGVRMRNQGNSALWREWSPQTGAMVPRSAPTGPQPLEPDSQVWRMVGASLFSREVAETRLYGWPLRGLSVQGLRIQSWTLADPDRDDLIIVLQDDHWTDALLDFEHHPNWSFDADQPPASGLPWRPLWLPFLANSLILGVPLTLAGFGVSRAARAGLAKLRGRGDGCPRCGYPRKGLARGAACPECGGG